SGRAGTRPAPRWPASRCARPPPGAHAPTSRRTAHRGASRRSAGRARHRRGGSSSRRLVVGKDRGDIDRMTLQFLGKDEEAVLGHALRVENAIEMVAFMLHDPRMKPGHLALDRVAVEVEAAIAHAQMA